VFLENIFGEQKYSRALQPPWFERWTWLHLHYDAEKDNVVCFICVKAMEHNLVQRKYRRDTAVTQGFCIASDRSCAPAKGNLFTFQFHLHFIKVLLSLIIVFMIVLLQR